MKWLEKAAKQFLKFEAFLFYIFYVYQPLMMKWIIPKPIYFHTN